MLAWVCCKCTGNQCTHPTQLSMCLTQKHILRLTICSAGDIYCFKWPAMSVLLMNGALIMAWAIKHHPRAFYRTAKSKRTLSKQLSHIYCQSNSLTYTAKAILSHILPKQLSHIYCQSNYLTYTAKAILSHILPKQLSHIYCQSNSLTYTTQPIFSHTLPYEFSHIHCQSTYLTYTAHSILSYTLPSNSLIYTAKGILSYTLQNNFLNTLPNNSLTYTSNQFSQIHMYSVCYGIKSIIVMFYL